MRTLLIPLLVLLLFQSATAEKPRVAILGDSISTGAHAKPPVEKGFPAVLAATLADSHEVRAFALSSRTLLRKADLPFVETQEFRDALAWKPDVAFVILGTNDTAQNEKRKNWDHHADLADDYWFLIGELKKVNPAIQIHLCSPPPMVPDQPGLAPDVAAERRARAPRIQVMANVAREVAEQQSYLHFQDLQRVIRSGQTSDGVHPNNEGHAQIAARLAYILTTEWETDVIEVVSALEEADVDPVKFSQWNGFPRYDFSLPESGAQCIIVAPHEEVRGTPWIMRARFFGHQPALDFELLDRGFHLCYCDVSNLYGSPAAVERWAEFTALVTDHLAFSPSPVLEGMSRGGLIIFNFASAHPEQVTAIYGDNPVCDFKSWPGGKNGKLSAADWERCLKAHGITAAEAADHPQPKDEETLESIADMNIPVALVIGTADDVVPPAENAEALAATYEKLGGPIKIWRKPGLGHHPHGLTPPDELRDFILNAVFKKDR